MISLPELLITAYFWMVSSVATVIAVVVCLIVYPFVDQKTFSGTYELVAGYIILNSMIFTGIWSFKITDLRKPENRHFNDRYVIISNHCSFIDTLLISTLPGFISK